MQLSNNERGSVIKVYAACYAGTTNLKLNALTSILTFTLRSTFPIHIQRQKCDELKRFQGMEAGGKKPIQAKSA
jgi:hypothetical protein